MSKSRAGKKKSQRPKTKSKPKQGAARKASPAKKAKLKKPKRPATPRAAGGKPAKQPSASGVQYGVLTGTVVRGKREPDQNKPHYTVTIATGDVKNQQAVINVRSSVGSGVASEVLFFVDANLLGQSPEHAELAAIWKKKTTALAKLARGFHGLPDHAPGLALDYVREAYMHRDEMQHETADGPGDNDDVQDQLDFWIKKAAADQAVIHVFGSGFPGGIHDVHMNQGNSGSFAADNGAFQDGGVVLSFPSGISVGIFVAFQSQSWNTDANGNPK